MRHRKRTFKIGRTASHRRCLVANMLKDLVLNGRIETTLAKAKEVRRHADKLITLAKQGDINAKRRVRAQLMLRYNQLTSKEARAAKNGDESAFNGDRQILKKLFDELGPQYQERPGGYTRVVHSRTRVGDNAKMAVLEYI